MLDVFYNDVLRDKVRAILAEASEFPVEERKEFCQKKCGLTYVYLQRVVRGEMKKPSSRVLMNLGYELLLKDLATGVVSPLELNVVCDWNPQNPRMNPVSMPVSVRELPPTSSTSE
jgi:hypothetical protein